MIHNFFIEFWFILFLIKMYNSFHTDKYRENSKQCKNDYVHRTPKDNDHFADDKLSITNPNIGLKPKNAKYNYILNLNKRNALQFDDCSSKVPYNNMGDSLGNNAYIASSKKKLKSNTAFNQQDSPIKQKEQSDLEIFQLKRNVLYKVHEDFDNKVPARSNGMFSVKLEPSIEQNDTNSQTKKTDETDILNCSKRILDHFKNIKKLNKLGITDHDTFVQRDSADKFTVNFQFDKLLLIRDGDDLFKIIVLEPLNQLENKKSEIIVNSHTGFVKLSSYGCIEVTIMITLSRLNCNTIKFVLEKVFLDEKSKTPEAQPFDVPYVKNEDPQQDPIQNEKTPDRSLTKFKKDNLRNGNEYQISQKKLNLPKNTRKD